MRVTPDPPRAANAITEAFVTVEPILVANVDPSPAINETEIH